MSELHKIALTLIQGVGSVTAKHLLSYCGDSEEVFRSKPRQLLKIPGVGPKVIEAIKNPEVLRKAEKELEFIQRYSIQLLFFSDSTYPQRLKHCEDAPVLLYLKGKVDLNQQKVISIVGTRNATEYGKEICKQFLAGIARHNPLIISGLAYGVDIAAHKESLRNNLATVAILGHGLDRIYPSNHRTVAEKMLQNGGLLTEFISGTKPDRENFPMRNRIIAGLCDATIVVEAKISGGALITADIANSYNRDVFTFPGNIFNEQSQGCNELIKSNKAQLITSAQDLEYFMGWQENGNVKNVQKSLFIDLNPEEREVLSIINSENSISIDEILMKSSVSASKLSQILLNLEFNLLVKQFPGKIYKVL